MTKDEFLQIVQAELDRLEQEQKVLYKKIDYYNKAGYGKEEIDKLNYLIRLSEQKVVRLRHFVEMPAFVRIQAMSDVELEAHKNEKIEDIELKIQEIEAKEKQDKEALANATEENERLVGNYSKVNSTEQETIIQRARELRSIIADIKLKLTAYDLDLRELRERKERIKGKTTEEIREGLLEGIKSPETFAIELENIQKPSDFEQRLLASVANDPEKANAMRGLLHRYYEEFNEKNRKVEQLREGAPYVLRSQIYDFIYKNSNLSSEVLLVGIEKLMEEYQKSFETAKIGFNKNFSLEKLLRLAGKKYSGYTPSMANDIDVEFFDQHADKISLGKIEELHSLVEQKNKLSKKIIKTRKTNGDIYDLNCRIAKLATDISREIIKWYESQDLSIFDINIQDKLSFENPDRIADGLRRLQQIIEFREREFSEFQEKFISTKQSFEEDRPSFDKRIADIVRKMVELSGIPETEEYYKLRRLERSPIRIYEDRYGVRERMLESGALEHRKDVLTRVRQEAQNQADTREAELRNITVEQLLELRKQALSAQQPEIQTVKEESQGMKM